jgi:hypothetical protein
MFMVRMIFWLTLVIAFIPVNEQDLSGQQNAISTGETLGAVQSALSDLSGFCIRNPATCETGSELLWQFGAKAKNGMQFVYSYFQDVELPDNSSRRIDSASSSSANDNLHTGSLAID